MADAAAGMRSMSPRTRKHKTWDQGALESLVRGMGLSDDLPEDDDNEHNFGTTSSGHVHHSKHARHTSMLGLEMHSGAFASLLLEQPEKEEDSMESPLDRVPDIGTRRQPKQRRSVTFAGSLHDLLAEEQNDFRVPSPPTSSPVINHNGSLSPASASPRGPLKSALRSSSSGGGARAPGHHRATSDTSGLFLPLSAPRGLSRLSSAENLFEAAPRASTPSPDRQHNKPPSPQHHQQQHQQQQQQQQQHQQYEAQQHAEYMQQQHMFHGYMQPQNPYYDGPPPLATAEQLHALQTMQSQMMTQWMQMQEQHQRLLMLEQQRMAAATAAAFYQQHQYMPPPPPFPMGHPPSPQSAPTPYNPYPTATPPSASVSPPPRTRSTSPSAGAAPSSSSSSMPAAAQEIMHAHRALGQRPSAESLRGLVGVLARDAHGSRMLQALNDGWRSEAERDAVLSEVLADADALIRDVFGNYVVQNMLVRSAPAQRDQLVAVVRGRCVMFAQDPFGTRVVQRALEVAPAPVRHALAWELCADGEEGVARLARDVNATHVVQKALDLALGIDVTQTQGRGGAASPSAPRNGAGGNRTARRGGPVPGGPLPALSGENARFFDAVERAVAQDIAALSRSQHASRVVLLVLRDCDAARSEAMTHALAALEAQCGSLVWDQHGVFVMNHVLEHAPDTRLARAVHASVAHNVLRLATHKFGSHLVEKALARGAPAQRTELVRRLLDRDGSGARTLRLAAHEGAAEEADVLMHLAQNQYGNFVLSRAFSVSAGEDKDELAAQLRARAHMLARFTYGRHILHHIGR